MTMTDRELMNEALAARKMAYAPYSRFMVGAALLAKDGRLFTGCNIENAAYSPSNCAERTAFFSAVKEGVREFEAIAIAGGMADTEDDALDTCTPCGVCRQVLNEFVNAASFRVITKRSDGEPQSHTLSELLPFAFGPRNLE